MASSSGFLFGVLLAVQISANLDGGVLILVLSQNSSYNLRQAEQLRAELRYQSEQHHLKMPSIKIIPEDFNHPGAWTIYPIIQRLSDFCDDQGLQWILFCEDTTSINLPSLHLTLSGFKHEENKWFGYGLTDHQPTIIHHYSFPEERTSQPLFYPLFSAGFIVPVSLIKKVKWWETEGRSEFSIDASYELAQGLTSAGGSFLHTPHLFCLQSGPACAAHPSPPQTCSTILSLDEVFFAVKTCRKFHEDRVPILLKTWGHIPKYIEFFSDFENKTIPTTSVQVKNTQRGHCEKTMEIIKISNSRIKKLKSIKWLFLSDDDTIISVKRLLSFLACYEENIVIGERYGYNVRYPATSNSGYNYITGGGGIAIGVKVINQLADLCHCPSADSPDDMLLGACLAAYRIPIIHSALFHQARPLDYSQGYLESQMPVSFHKHTMVDPISLYNKWFLADDTGVFPKDEL